MRWFTRGHVQAKDDFEALLLRQDLLHHLTSLVFLLDPKNEDIKYLTCYLLFNRNALLLLSKAEALSVPRGLLLRRMCRTVLEELQED